MYGFQLWLPKIIKGFGGLTDGQTALVTVIPAHISSAGHDRNCQKFGKVRRASLACSCFGNHCRSRFYTDQFDNESLAGTCNTEHHRIWYLGNGVVHFWSLGTSILPPRVKAAGIGFVNSTGNLGGFVGLHIVGVMKQATGGFHGGLYVMAASLLMAGILSFFSEKLLKKGTRIET